MLVISAVLPQPLRERRAVRHAEFAATTRKSIGDIDAFECRFHLPCGRSRGPAGLGGFPYARVHRRLLHRIGDKVARATSIVRYALASHFSPHVHDGGEEFLVLDGVFQDEHGDYPAGNYIRNPPTTSHTPGSGPGCTIFVKLWQFDPNDRTRVRLDTNAGAFIPVIGRPGVDALPLFEDAYERVRLERWAPRAAVELTASGGIELLVLDGGFTEGDEAFATQSWLRLPTGTSLQVVVGPQGCRVWVKTGHLVDIRTATDAA